MFRQRMLVSDRTGVSTFGPLTAVLVAAVLLSWMENGYVYANQEFGGWDRPLHIIDLADPQAPIHIGDFRAAGPPLEEILGPHNPFVRDGLLYWAYYDAGVRIFDLSEPEQPVETGYHPTVAAWGA